MKKSKLAGGIIAVVIGTAALIAVLFFDKKFYGMIGAFLVPGVMCIRECIQDYVYWNAPENRERYREMQEYEAIEQHDELREKIRDKSGRYAYLIGVYTVGASLFVIELLRAFEVIDYDMARPLELYLCGYLIVQYFAERVISRHISGKY